MMQSIRTTSHIDISTHVAIAAVPGNVGQERKWEADPPRLRLGGAADRREAAPRGLVKSSFNITSQNETNQLQEAIIDNHMLPHGLGPWTSRLLAERSNQLSYESGRHEI